MSHLERDILKGKFGNNKQLKKEAREEDAEEKVEKKTGKHVKIREIAGKMKKMSKEERSKKAGFYVHGHKNYGDVYEA